ncbi:MAG: inorganic phosphate transporter, partial [Phycisphaeraceae bacterium]
MDVVLILVAGAFAVFNGVNDGGSILATTLRTTTVRPVTAIVVLTTVVGAAPYVVGTQVAATLLNRLAGFSGDGDALAFMIAVVSASAVVIVLARWGLPTSLTLALLGGIVGVGLGAGLPIAWQWVGIVLILAALAPFAGLVLAIVVLRLWRVLPLRFPIGRQVRQGQRVGMVLQALAYGANDGQKMLAVFAVALPLSSGTGGVVEPTFPVMLTISLLFAVGTLIGFRRYGATIGSSIVPVTPVGSVTAQLATASAVSATAAIGAPVSMTQAVAGSLIGTAIGEGSSGRVRWTAAA